MFDNFIQSIFEARGETMPPKDVIHMETALLNFYLCCYPGRMDHISCYLDVCAISLQEEDTHGAIVAAGLETDVNLTLSANHLVHPYAPDKSSAHAYTQNCARIRAQQRTMTPNYSYQ